MAFRQASYSWTNILNALANDLQAGIKILWYQIESVLGRGGFGITYLARDNNLGQLVAIKEYLPHEFGTRSGDSTVQPISEEQNEVYNWGLERFMSEAQTLAKFKHPNIVRVLSVFKENNTGYMVMEYEQGDDLKVIYKQKGKLTQRELEDIYYPIIDGLTSVHKEGFIHRDIKPANIYIRSDGSPVLIDFGAARQAIGNKTKTLTSMLSVGYAPFEQYNDAQGKQGPWTDIYSLGASLHQGITGEKPLESTLRGMALLHNEHDPYKPLSHSGLKGYTPAFLRTIDHALNLQVHDRPQTLEDFLGMLKGEIELPDIPKIPEPVVATTVIRDRTVVRPRKQKSSDVDVTASAEYVKTEKIATTPKDAPGSTVTEANNQQPPSAPVDKQRSPSDIRLLISMLVIAAVIVGVVFYPTSEQSPEELHQQKLDDLLKNADELIASGKYYNKAGDGALGTYQQILAIEPDSSTAKNGINNVAQHFLLQTEQFIENQDITQAKASLKIVSFINSEYPGLKNAQSRISDYLNSEKKFKQVGIYLNQANKALQQGQPYQPERQSAAFYFQNVLKLDPSNVTASRGLFEIADTIIDDAQTALNKNDTRRAALLISRAEAINPDKPAIQTIRMQIDETNQLKLVLAKADKAYAKNRYTTPKNDNAYEFYTQVLIIEPSNLHAQGRLNKVADYFVDRTRKYTQSGNIASANTNLNTLATYFPSDPNISKLKSAINKKRKQINAAKLARKKSLATEEKKKPAIPPIKKEPSTNKQWLPVGVNQQQDDNQVVQDIVGLFINAFKNRDMKGLSNVAQMTGQQQSLYGNIFNLYQSLNIKVAPNSFTLSKKSGLASIKIEIIDLVDAKGNPAVTSAYWTKIELIISKKNGSWTKAAII